MIRRSVFRPALLESLDRRVHQEFSDDFLGIRIGGLGPVLRGTLHNEQANQIVDIVYFSLFCDLPSKRHTIGMKFARQSEETMADSSQILASRRLALILQVSRFDDPAGGLEVETRWWDNFESIQSDLQQYRLAALPIIQWSGDASIAARINGLTRWFAKTRSDETRQGILGSRQWRRCIAEAGIRSSEYESSRR